MNISIDFFAYAKWLGIATLGFLLLTVVAFIVRWGIRFRLVGITAFMGVLTSGLFALAISLFNYVEIPGAVDYKLVYDNGANQAVIAVSGELTESEVEATLRQAARDLFSYGRIGLGDDKFIIRIRTLLHPEPGLTQPLFLGKVRRSLSQREDEQMQIEVFSDNLALLSERENS